ncbi:MAG: MCP four helix bundle domain-containing protein, partial [Syntrophales bacterium]|nr:MCP four helix bundle domain-containing protein [Syntrophales bacterium]
MFKNMKIGLRLGLGFGVVIVLMLVLGLLAINRLAHIDASLTNIVKDKYPKTVLANEIHGQVNVVARALRNALLAQDPRAASQELQRVAQSQALVSKKIGELTKVTNTEGGKARLQALVEAQSRYAPVEQDLIKAVEAGKKDEAQKALITKLRPVQAKYLTALEDLSAYQAELMAQASQDAAASYSQTRMLTITILILSIILACVIVFLVNRSITKPLNEAVRINNQMAEGDLSMSIEVNRRDETGQILAAMQKLIERIRAITADLNMLTAATVEGNLTFRADTAKHQGDFRKIIEGVNYAFDAIVGHLDSMPAPALIVDREFNLKYINRVGASLTGLAAEALIGTKCYDHFKTSHCRTDKCATG